MLIEGEPQSSAFAKLPDAAGDEIFAVNHAFTIDPHPQKVSLALGVYRTNEGKPWPLPSVRMAEEKLFAENDIHRHEYQAIEGDKLFLKLARDLIFGFNGHTESLAEKQAKRRIASVQTVSGTGANHVGALFLAQHLKPKHVWISNPSWPNHQTIWSLVDVPRKTYPYFNSRTRSFDFCATIDILESEAQEGDVIVLHACSHNPTGTDPTMEQWIAIADLCERKRLFPFLIVRTKDSLPDVWTRMPGPFGSFLTNNHEWRCVSPRAFRRILAFMVSVLELFILSLMETRQQ